jgi:hypothetical protein
MYGGCPHWGTFTPAPARTVRIRATDTGHSWLVTLGRFTGSDPDSGTSHDEPDIHAAETDPGEHAAAEISGAAADLDCWLWHRQPAGPVERSGDPGVLGDLDATIKPGIN